MKIICKSLFIFLGLLGYSIFVSAKTEVPSKSVVYLNEYYSKDVKHVYFNGPGEPVALGADLKTFKVIGPKDSSYAKDAKNVYWQGQLIAEADPKTIVVLSDQYAKDAKRVFAQDRILKNADLSSFEALNAIYAKDAKNVYIETVDREGTIVNADPKTFSLLNSSDQSAYSKDAKAVYFFGELVPGADAVTFTQVTERYGKDKDHVFLMKGILPEAEVNSFRAIAKNDWYAADKKNVYNYGKTIQGADLESFKVLEQCTDCGKGCFYCSQDKNNKYDVHGKVINVGP